ncbi:MAG: tetratricopeptide repeat protein [Planctomycetes bacterium]|nr:tetratricopeptide repeat protein [Planctomycetota bacterium]
MRKGSDSPLLFREGGPGGLGFFRLALVAVLLCASAALAPAGPLDEMDLKRWEKLKEAERFQLNAAERLYRESQWKAAADEYEKFLKLYEKSEGAPYAQLKWSHCHVALRKQNTAIKDGYQSLLDYYPDSPEAPIAALLIGRTHRDIGDTKPAKKAYGKVIASHPKHFAAVMARLDLVDIATKEMDEATRAKLLRELTYDVERKGATSEPCAEASRQYARLVFHAGNFEEGLKALATSASEPQLPHLVMHPSWGALPYIAHDLTGSTDEATKKLGEKLTDAGAAWLKTQVAANLKDAKTKPQAMAAWYAVAELRRQARQPDKQKAVYEEIIAQQGADDVTLGYLAQWFKTNKQMEQARTTYAKFADKAKGQGQIALTYRQETPKQTDKAVAIYRQLAADVKTAPRWLEEAAMAYREAGKPDQAIAVYRELLTANAAKADTYAIYIADSLYYAGRWKECIAAYRGTNNFPTNYNHMAAANRQLKQYDEAIVLYRQIIAASPAHASAAYWQIALTQAEAGKKEDEIKTLKLICDKFPKTGEGSAAHTRLNDVHKIPVTLGGAKD